MNISKTLLLVVSHGIVAAAGFAGGIYALPILIAPKAPSEAELKAIAPAPLYTGQFRRELKGSDALHYGVGTVSLAASAITFTGKLSPGPDFKLYLSPEFVETEADFKRLKHTMVRVGDVKTFENFAVPLPSSIDAAKYTTAIVWCESFGQFITAARYAAVKSAL